MTEINEVQIIPNYIYKLDNEDPKVLKKFVKQYKKYQKWMKKRLIKSMFTPWQRFKIWFFRIRI